jgi:uncharacterized protein YndB with AHSA1/START domain
VNETLRSVDGRSTLRVERRLDHPPTKVWRAVTDPDHLARWFPFTVQLDPGTGGEISFFAPDRPDVAASSGTVTAYEPPWVFAFTWGDDLLHFDLSPEASGCLLIFTHTFDDRAGAASFAAGWEVCLDALTSDLAGEPVDVAAPTAELHERYVRTFGLDEGTVEETADGWRVRFERQLTRPTEAVWTDLTTDDVPTPGGPPPAAFTTTAAPAGTVTAVTAPTLVEYDWRHDGRPAGRVSWQLTDGTGHGARLVVTQTGTATAAGQQAAALAGWRAYVEELARVGSAGL